MKIILTILIIVMSFTSNAFGQTKKLDIVIKGIEEVQGQVIVLVFNKKEHFPNDQKLAKRFKFPVIGKEMTVSVNLLVEDCAIFVYHDKDNNEKCNQNKLGMPKEKIAFSNNVKPKLKAPSFESAKVDKDATKISVELYDF